MSLFALSDIRFAYAARPAVLDGVSLRLDAGERLALVGDNGAGKSTLLSLMVGLLKPSGGTVEAFGRARVTEADFAEIRPRAGLVFQDPDDQLFCPTVAEDVAFGPLNTGASRAEARRIVSDTLNGLGLAGFEDRVTHHLSGGEKRLVSLAAVLAMQPEALLLDEPTNALDAKARARLIEVLSGLPQAMVIVSHDPEVREALATRAVLLESGRVADEYPL
ncbi:ATPase component NikO of energizing module of nickel ECF transporter [Caenispirillum salinarum AK4]|uniref:ATPase component NikO of energizing module of nickel ECF transporter n=1 Tax=Caenispirillum salinarum AK4 TaxID=1238182 RepID=K9HW17_9PROT|nr:ABC transporter ATP-binding protein [Caenispirillum salinarum]EKV32426.1 ATPase component NikO of energizing module of nickel ECF transporter [Caenispirillum salinarum AK4]